MDAKDVADIISHGRSTRCGEGWKINCPCHEDDTPSLVIYDGNYNSYGNKFNYRPHCYAGCNQRTIEKWIFDNCGIPTYGRVGEGTGWKEVTK